MPDWRSGAIGVVTADEDVSELIKSTMSACGVSTLNLYLIPKYKISCLNIFLNKYNFSGLVYIFDVYGVTTQLALERRINRERLLERAWDYISSIICAQTDQAECNDEVRLKCCKRRCGPLCELAKYVASAKRGVVIDMRDELRRALDISQDL